MRDEAREHLGREEAPTSGSLGETDLPALIRIFEAGRGSGVLRLAGPAGAAGTLWFRDGRIIDGQAGRRSGEAAFHDLLSWRVGTWTVSFEPVERTRTVALGTQALLVEGARRAAELARLARRLPPRDRPLEIDFRLLSERLAEIPDEVNGLLRLLDGRRSLGEVLAVSADELAAASAVARLHAEGIVRPVAEPVAPAPSAPSAAAVDWFAGPAGGEPAPAPEEAPPDRPGAPRIVRFPPRGRETGSDLAPPVHAPESPQAWPGRPPLEPEAEAAQPLEPAPRDEPPVAPLARPVLGRAPAGADRPRRRLGVLAAVVVVIAAGVATCAVLERLK